MDEPFPVTGVFEAEQFDHGGLDVGYHTLDAAHATTNYRVSRLWITNCTDMGGGFHVDKLRAGEWLQYTMDVTASQTWAVETRAAGLSTNGAFKVEFFTNGTMYAWTTNNLVLTDTNWANVTFKNLWLEAGTNVMRVTMLTNGLVNGNPSSYAAKLNYISIYPSWNEGLPASATNEVFVSGLIAETSDWLTASNNTVNIQSAIDSLTASGGTVYITNTGKIYLASREITDESRDAERNTAVFVYRNNVQIQGAGKTDTTLVAHNRAVTVFYVGKNVGLNDVAVTNITLTDLTLEGSPHWVYDGGEPDRRRWEEGGLSSAFTPNSGVLMACRGISDSQRLQNLMITNCLIKNSPCSAIQLVNNVRNFLARHTDFVFWADGTNGTFSGTTSTQPPGYRTGNYQKWDVGIFSTGLLLNANVIECSYNGNVTLTNVIDTGEFGDGILWHQGWNASGNWFSARNAITNYQLEAIQWQSGPAAAVQHTFFTYMSVDAACALANTVSLGASGPSGQSIDRSFAFVGNTVTGGWRGV